MVSAIIFDFFGVIGASTYQLIAEKINITEYSQLADITDLHKSIDNGYVTQEEFLHQYAKIANLPYAEFLEIYHNCKNRFSVSGQLIEYIGDLKKQGYKIGLLSNVNKEAYEEFVKPIVVQGNYFDAVMPSFKTGLVKPAAVAFLGMAHKLDILPENCLMVDDLEQNCRSAESIGMKAIIYQNIHQFKTELKQYLLEKYKKDSIILK